MSGPIHPGIAAAPDERRNLLRRLTQSNAQRTRAAVSDEVVASINLSLSVGGLFDLERFHALVHRRVWDVADSMAQATHVRAGNNLLPTTGFEVAAHLLVAGVGGKRTLHQPRFRSIRPSVAAKLSIHLVIESLRELASEDEQRRLWLSDGTNGADVSSFIEAQAGLFNDSGLGDRLERGEAVFGDGRADRFSSSHPGGRRRRSLHRLSAGWLGPDEPG